MKKFNRLVCASVASSLALMSLTPASAQIGTRFPSERKVVTDPVPGVELTFLTSTPGQGDSKIYQTHNQWTADGQWVIFRSNRVRGQAMAVHEKTGVMEPAEPFGPRGMGGGPTGLASMNLRTGEVKFVVAVPFQIGHVQANPWMPGEIVFCWETGGKAPQRTWTVKSDGSGLRPLYPEAAYEWVTHEAVINRDEVAIAILSHRRPGVGVDTPDDWGPSGSGEHPTGVGIVNLRTREMRIVGQVPIGDPGRSVWHVHGSPDGRWAVADDFQYRLWIIDRKSGEMAVLADLGRKTGAADHIHPTFSADSKKIEVQTAMLSEDGRSLNICVIPVPDSWLMRTYGEKIE